MVFDDCSVTLYYQKIDGYTRYIALYCLALCNPTLALCNPTSALCNPTMGTKSEVKPFYHNNMPCQLYKKKFNYNVTKKTKELHLQLLHSVIIWFTIDCRCLFRCRKNDVMFYTVTDIHILVYTTDMLINIAPGVTSILK